jgi:hypothetical protein
VTEKQDEDVKEGYSAQNVGGKSTKDFSSPKKIRLAISVSFAML